MLNLRLEKKKKKKGQSMISCRGVSCSIKREATPSTPGNIPSHRFSVLMSVISWRSSAGGKSLPASPEHHLGRPLLVCVNGPDVDSLALVTK